MCEFKPFYDRFAEQLLSKVLVAFGLGFAFFLLHWLALGHEIYKHSGWVLSPLISFAVLFQYYATDTFRNALPEMQARLNERNEHFLCEYANEVLSDWEFVKTGLFFGVLNTFMGVLFGLPTAYQGFFPAATSYIGFFIAGFVCGIPVQGIIGVWRVFEKFATTQTLKVNYAAHDGRGGMEFVGAALARFAAVTLTEGVIIAWYIVHMQWSRQHNPYVNLVFLFWVTWPFILSTFVLIAPCVGLHRSLERAKREEDDRIQDKIRGIENQIDSASSQQTETLLKSYEHYKERRVALDKMRTWPYGYSAKIKYGGILLGNVLVAGMNVAEHWPNITEFREIIRHGLLAVKS
jgi:hypothetical protein